MQNDSRRTDRPHVRTRSTANARGAHAKGASLSARSSSARRSARRPSGSRPSARPSAAWSSTRTRGGYWPLILLVAAIVALAIAAWAIFSNATTDSSASDEGIAVDSVSDIASTVTYHPSIDSIDEIPSSTTPTAFCISQENSEVPTIPDDCISRINEAAGHLTEDGLTVGYILLDLENGQGVCCNIDEETYTASSIKGPFCAFVCEELLEGGAVSLDNTYTSYNDSRSATGSATLNDLMKDALENSSNGAYYSLYKALSANGYYDWVSENGVTLDESSAYAWYTSRDAAKLWVDMYLYFQQDTQYSQLLQEYLSSTTVSYIRDGINDEAATVYNKAGYYSSGTLKYDATVDNAIVSIDGHDYLFSIVTNADWTVYGDLVSNLASAIWSAHDYI